MKKIPIQDVLEGKLPKGTLIVVRWMDASDIKTTLQEHQNSPEIMCKDWGLYLGVSGRKKKLLLLGKDVVELHNEWGAARIPLDLVEDIHQLLPRTQITETIKEATTLGRRIRLRRYNRREDTIRVQVN